MEPSQFNIDLDKVLDIAYSGVRRASIFMGLGVNAALDSDFKEYQLTHITKLQLIPDTVDAKTICHFKEEFKTWVEGNGLRELIETFSVFLERINEAALFICPSPGMDNGALSESRDSFNRKGFPDKLKILRTKFSVGPKHSGCLESINKARNCLTHRRGIVGKKDVDESDKLYVAWEGLDVFIKTPSGEHCSLMDMPHEGLHFPKGGTICLPRFINRERVFEHGSLLRLSTRDLAEICWFFRREAESTRDSLMEYAKANGVTVLIKRRLNEAVSHTSETGAAGLDR